MRFLFGSEGSLVVKEKRYALPALIGPGAPHGIGKFVGERIRRAQFPLVLAWAKAARKSQGATEPRGAVATLGAHAAQTPGPACVALPRCQRLADVHLRALHHRAVAAPVGEARALGIVS